MPRAQYIDIAPAVLQWALSNADDTRRRVAEQKTPVLQWIAGEKTPTVNQVKLLATKLALPFGYLLVSKPPVREFAHAYFRKGVEADSARLSTDARAVVEDIDARSDWLEDYLTEQGVDPLPFVGSITMDESAASAADKIREVVAYDSRWTASSSSWAGAKRAFVAAIEEAGVSVAVSSIVGNNTQRGVDPEELNGFSIVRPRAPFIFVNAADYFARQIFTLAHELVHVWLGKGAIEFVDFASSEAVDEMEAYCNQVASYFLVPEAELSERYSAGADVDALAQSFRVSAFAINRALFDRGLVNLDHYLSELRDLKARLDAISVEKSSGGDANRNVPVRASKRFLSYLQDAYRGGRIDLRGAGRLIDVRGKSLVKALAE